MKKIGLIALMVIFTISTGCAGAVCAPKAKAGERHILVFPGGQEAVSTPTSIPVKEKTIGQEVFTLGKVVYKEDSSAKGKLEVYHRLIYNNQGQRGLEGGATNISNEVLDVEAFFVWKDASGKPVKTLTGTLTQRLLPGKSYPFGGDVMPTNTVGGEYWFKVKKSAPTPSSVEIVFVEHPSTKGKLKIVDYKTLIEGKDTVFERWRLESVTIKNISSGRIFDPVEAVLQFDTAQEDARMQNLRFSVRTLQPGEATIELFAGACCGGLPFGDTPWKGGTFPYDAREGKLWLEVMVGK